MRWSPNLTLRKSVFLLLLPGFYLFVSFRASMCELESASRRGKGGGLRLHSEVDAGQECVPDCCFVFLLHPGDTGDTDISQQAFPAVPDGRRWSSGRPLSHLRAGPPTLARTVRTTRPQRSFTNCARRKQRSRVSSAAGTAIHQTLKLKAPYFDALQLNLR